MVARFLLTKRQKEVVDFIAGYVAQKGYAPSYEELGEGLGMSAISTVKTHVDRLVRKGILRHSPGIPRSLQLVTSCPRCGYCGEPS